MTIKIIQGPQEKISHIHYEYDMESAPIGEGGMGVVYFGYRVDEESGVRTEVAIKKLHNDLSPEVYARAEREASIQLRHDNLVEMLGLISLFEKNRLGEPVYHHYVISEFLHGIELSDLLEGKFTNSRNEDNGFARKLYLNYQKDREKVSIGIIKNILSGVLALHDKGYIHRDIDPSNIMVTNDGHLKLIDFGIAKNLRSLESKDKLMTSAGQFLGKAEYASPELVLGDVKHQNYSTDIYALGILFYKLLVGALPFTGSQYEILQCQLKRRVPIHNIKNKALAKVIKKSTEKLQKNRYGSIAEFRVAIDHVENHDQKVFNDYWPYLIIVVLLGFFSWGIVSFLSNKEKETSESTTTLQNKVVEVPSNENDNFVNALNSLNSSDVNTVKIGFSLMQQLAIEDYDLAKMELGLTYYSVKAKNEVRSYQLLQRRELLSLEDGNVNELELSLQYFSSVKKKEYLSPEVYYIWGSALFNGKPSSFQQSLEKFEMALQLINSGKEVSHGYEALDLKNRLKKNISILSDAINKSYNE